MQNIVYMGIQGCKFLKEVSMQVWQVLRMVYSVQAVIARGMEYESVMPRYKSTLHI